MLYVREEVLDQGLALSASLHRSSNVGRIHKPCTQLQRLAVHGRHSLIDKEKRKEKKRKEKASRA